MKPEEREALLKVHEELMAILDVQNVPHLLNAALVITSADFEIIRNAGTQIEKRQLLIQQILPGKQNGWNGLIQALEASNQKHLAEKLKQALQLQNCEIESM